ncbi:hypothetical protein AB0M11_04330 [Streptomyces sp. NPDC051987]|uniref:hypothetical protein n=1 Tax=Streptomyces sp. NPDC051987 TaxID=3155808 RepID=UPI003444FD5C
MGPLPLAVQRAATAPAALRVKPAVTTSAAGPAQPVPLRPTTPISATASLPVLPVLPAAPRGRPTVQRDALTTALPVGQATSSSAKTSATHTARAEAPRTRTSRQPPPPDDPPPGYTAVEGGGFDPRALTEFQVDALVHRIIDRITRHVRTELRRDRERVGKLRDFRP